MTKERRRAKRQCSPGPSGDESLVHAHRVGNEQALDILFKRYLKPLRFYLLKISWYKDDGYLDDIRQQTLLTVFNHIQSGQFTPTGAGTFKAWLYTTAQNICRSANRKRVRRPKTISQMFPSEPTGVPDDLLMKSPTRAVDQTRLATKLNGILSALSLEEQKLMRLISQGKKHKQILREPEFARYSLDYLKLKVYNIRKKILKLQREAKKK